MLLFLLVFLIFADFLAPYTLNERNSLFSLTAPTRLHFRYQKKFIGPFIYSLNQTQMMPDLLKIQFFVRRKSAYKILGILQCHYHLFGILPEDKVQFYLLGSDEFGRDIFSRLILSGRISLIIAVCASFLAIVLGSYIGAALILCKKPLRFILEIFTELLQGLPRILLLFLLGNFLSSQTPLWQQCLILIMIFAVLSWVRFAKLIRSLVHEMNQREFILASQMIGANQFEILHAHIFPHLHNHQIIGFLNLIPLMLIIESTLSFLGQGIREPWSSWGSMLRLENPLVQLELSPWLLCPGLTIIIVNFFIHRYTHIYKRF